MSFVYIHIGLDDRYLFIGHNNEHKVSDGRGGFIVPFQRYFIVGETRSIQGIKTDSVLAVIYEDSGKYDYNHITFGKISFMFQEDEVILTSEYSEPITLCYWKRS